MQKFDSLPLKFYGPGRSSPGAKVGRAGAEAMVDAYPADGPVSDRL